MDIYFLSFFRQVQYYCLVLFPQFPIFMLLEYSLNVFFLFVVITIIFIYYYNLLQPGKIIGGSTPFELKWRGSTPFKL